MHSVTVSVDVSDTCEITSVVSNEAVDAKGSGNTEVDWEVTGALTVTYEPSARARVTVACTPSPWCALTTLELGPSAV